MPVLCYLDGIYGINALIIMMIARKEIIISSIHELVASFILSRIQYDHWRVPAPSLLDREA